MLVVGLFWVKGKEVEPIVRNHRSLRLLWLPHSAMKNRIVISTWQVPPGSKILNIYAHAYTDINKMHPWLAQARDTANV